MYPLYWTIPVKGVHIILGLTFGVGLLFLSDVIVVKCGLYGA